MYMKYMNSFISNRFSTSLTNISTKILGVFFGLFVAVFPVLAETAQTTASAAPSGQAQAAPESVSSSLMSQGLILAVIFAFIYFMTIRPQSKRAKEHRAMLSNLQKGDEVITSGGIVGRVVKMTDDFLVLNINNDIEMIFQRSAVAGLLPKGTMKSI